MSFLPPIRVGNRDWVGGFSGAALQLLQLVAVGLGLDGTPHGLVSGRPAGIWIALRVQQAWFDHMAEDDRFAHSAGTEADSLRALDGMQRCRRWLPSRFAWRLRSFPGIRCCGYRSIVPRSRCCEATPGATTLSGRCSIGLPGMRDRSASGSVVWLPKGVAGLITSASRPR